MKKFLTFIVFGFLSSSVVAEDKNITFATDWKAQAEHGGFYQAAAKGLYKKYGLNVHIRSGGPQTDNPRLMAAGALDIAIASNNFQPLNLVAAGADVKVVMTTFQKDPQVLMVHPEVQASGFKDFKGMPIFLADSAIATFWPWLKYKFGYEDRQIRKYTYSLAPWLVNKGTVQEGYVSSEPFSAVQAGVKPKVFLFADEGYLGYAGMVMVRSEYLNSNKDVVKAFVQASIEGWRDYLWGDPSEANKLILADNKEMTPELIAFSINAMRTNEMLGSKEKLGRMTDKRWKDFHAEMSEMGLLPKSLDVTKAYTLEFLPTTE
ncbi:ABC transporter substrate-binding protein [Kordiimonas laminariae]|uniref:ABC transporter substrate-binding protein n=1 Tax=Kordiimonas laminariae TaxID=2917717 RepID=UPI001FF3E354|nr:ABC transporter substrate-binding protein [Kordiimonas laminariae]MCK0069912.1 ABC transporter substrate-binding protein [Kordiimonas laminariae]